LPIPGAEAPGIFIRRRARAMTQKAGLRLRVFLGSVYAAGAVALGGVVVVAHWRVSFHQ